MTRQFWLILGVIIVILGGALVISDRNKASAPGTSSNSSKGQVSKHVQGTGTSGVTLVEYGDYQCPICGTFYSAVKEVQAKYNDQVFFQFSNLPLRQIHPNAFAAARAAEAAGKQGKYFEMHDVLYENQSTWSQSTSATAYFDQYAEQLGLNTTKFKTDFASTAVNNVINADIAAFDKTGHDQATPTFFLDGKALNNTDLFDGNTPSLDKFSALIDAEIAVKTKQ